MTGNSNEQINLDTLLADADTLPSFSGITSGLLERIDDPYSVPDDFTTIISQDQLLVGRILKFANSAFYGFPRRIDSLKEAIIILGMDTLKSIVLAISTFQTLSTGIRGYGLQMGELYNHALCAAMVARNLAKKRRQQNKEKFFIAGLLHDVGKLLLEPWTLQHQQTITTCIRNGELTLAEAEKRVLGFDHAFIGARLGERWNLPASLIAMIEYHHQPDACPEEFRDDAALIYAANAISYTLNKGVGQPLLPDDHDLDSINRFFSITERESKSVTSLVREALLDISGLQQ